MLAGKFFKRSKKTAPPIGVIVSVSKATADSLEKSLATANSLNKLNIYKQLTWYYRQKNVQKAKKFADLGIALANKENALFYKADFLRFKALIGLFFEYNTNAGIYLEQSIAISESINYKDGLAFCYNLIHTIYFEDNNLSDAFLYLKKSYHLFLETQNVQGLIYSNSHLSQYYFKKNMVDSSIYYVEGALGYAKILNDSNQISYQYNLLSKYFINLNRLDSAKYYVKISSSFAEYLEQKYFIIDIYNLKTKIFITENKKDSAVAYALKALELSKSIAYLKGTETASYNLYKYYKALGEKDKALGMLIIHDSCQDIQNHFQLNQKVTSSTLSYLYKQKILTEEIEKKRLNSIIWGLSFLVFFLFFIGMFLKRKILNKNLLALKKQNIIIVNILDELTEKNQLIEAKNAQLEKSLLLNEKILYLISHNFRAPLTNIQSLFLMLQNNEIQPHELKQFIPSLLNSSNQGLIILDNVLYWSGVNNSKTVTYDSSIAVVPTIHEQIKKIIPIVEEKNILFNFNIDKQVDVKFNIALFEIIIRNMLTICISKADNNSVIDLTVRTISKYVEIEFNYNGDKVIDKGIDELSMLAIDFSEQNLIYCMGVFICKKYIEEAQGVFSINNHLQQNTISICLLR